MNFDQLQLYHSLIKNLTAIDFHECTPVQEKVIPAVLEGKDISALAQTGTGKTAAFLLPLLDRILRTKNNSQDIEKRIFPNWKSGHFVLILVPTRELAEQVYQDFEKFTTDIEIEAVAIYGGSSYEAQKKKVADRVEFVIGTPGRLIDLYKNHIIDLRQVRAVVFDEADRMFDMGFKDDMRYLLQRIPKNRQYLMFSATLNFDVLHSAYRFGAEPVEFDLSRDVVKSENVDDCIFHIGENDKPQYLLSILKKKKPRQTIVFSNFKINVERIAGFLRDNGISAMGISSLLTQGQRHRVMAQFREVDNNQNILIATDVAARGLDIQNVDLVINYELPDDSESYVHRIGRTGRAGERGHAMSLVCEKDVEALQRIENFLKYKIEIGWLEDGELTQDMKPILSAYDMEKNKRPYKPLSSSKKKESGDRKKRDSRQKEKSYPREDDNIQGHARGVHRDRRSGRHNKKQQSHVRKRKTKVKKQTRRRSLRKKTTSKVQKTNKVARFFKKLWDSI